MVICVDNPFLITKISENFPLINLDFTLCSFIDMVDGIERQKDTRWNNLKEEYVSCKTKLKKEIYLIQNLNQ